MANLTITSFRVDDVSVGQPEGPPIPGKVFAFEVQDAAGRKLRTSITRTDGTRPTRAEMRAALIAAFNARPNKDAVVGTNENIAEIDLSTKETD